MRRHSTNCGICNTNFAAPSKGILSTNGTSVLNLTCGGCMNFKLLKLKLELVETEHVGHCASKQVDEVLSHCINGRASDFIHGYLELETDKEKQRQLLQQPSPQVRRAYPVPSTDSAARLAQVLLNVEVSQYHRTIKRNSKQIAAAEREVEGLRLALKTQRERIRSRHTNLDSQKKNLQENNAIMRAQMDREIHEYRDEKADAVKKLLSNERSKLFQQLIKVFGIRELNTKRQLKASNQVEKLNNTLAAYKAKKDDELKLMMCQIPVIPIGDFFEYSAPIINTSLENICRFVSTLSLYLNITLPYEIVVFPTPEFIKSVNNARGTQLEPLRPHLFSNLSATECHPVYLPFESTDKKKSRIDFLVDASNLQVLSLSKGIAGLIIDLVYMIKITSQRFKDFNKTQETPEVTSFEEAMRLDGLMWMLLYNEKFHGGKPVVREEDQVETEATPLSVPKARRESGSRPSRRVSISEAIVGLWRKKSQTEPAPQQESDPEDKEEDTVDDFEFWREEKADSFGRKSSSSIVFDSVLESKFELSPLTAATNTSSSEKFSTSDVYEFEKLYKHIYEYFARQILKKIELQSKKASLESSADQPDANAKAKLRIPVSLIPKPTVTTATSVDGDMKDTHRSVSAPVSRRKTRQSSTSRTSSTFGNWEVI